MAKLEEHAKAKSMQERIADLRARRDLLEMGGGHDRTEKLHASGRLTARERIASLVDKGSFEEIGVFAIALSEAQGGSGGGEAGGNGDQRPGHKGPSG